MARLHDCFSLQTPPFARTHLMPFYLPMPASIHRPAANGRICLGFTFCSLLRSSAPSCLLYKTVRVISDPPRRGFHPQDNCDMPISPLPPSLYSCSCSITEKEYVS
ncbi:hypothetical protein V8C40DRAFT_247807 [Trichoderma camerunense]